MKILFFLESLQSGGKERRSVELIRFLKDHSEEYEIELVVTDDQIHFEEIYETGVRIRILQRKGVKYDPSIFFRFFRICRNFKPDLIHCFGKMTTFYAIPSKVICGIPLISSLIADSKKSYNSFSPYSLLFNINLFFSDIVLANSYAGLKAYNINLFKARVIHNGVDLNRFLSGYDEELLRDEFKINTRFIVVMVAGFSSFKDYDLFIDVARETGKKRNDVTFLGVGDGSEWNRIKNRIEKEGIENVILTGRQKSVERIIASSDIGILCTKSEGISNSIIEYMALGKPVIATDMNGGSRELILDGETGYCTERKTNTVTELIIKLLENPVLRAGMGEKGKQRIESSFSISRMGNDFRLLYAEILAEKKYRKASVVKKTAG